MSTVSDGATHCCTMEEVRMAPGTSRPALRTDDLPGAVGLHPAGAQIPSTTGCGAPS